LEIEHPERQISGCEIPLNFSSLVSISDYQRFAFRRVPMTSSIRSNSILPQTAEAPALINAAFPASCDDTAMIGKRGRAARHSRTYSSPFPIIQIVVGQNQIKNFGSQCLSGSCQTRNYSNLVRSQKLRDYLLGEDGVVFKAMDFHRKSPLEGKMNLSHKSLIRGLLFCEELIRRIFLKFSESAQVSL